MPFPFRPATLAMAVSALFVVGFSANGAVAKNQPGTQHAFLTSKAKFSALATLW